MSQPITNVGAVWVWICYGLAKMLTDMLHMRRRKSLRPLENSELNMATAFLTLLIFGLFFYGGVSSMCGLTEAEMMSCAANGVASGLIDETAWQNLIKLNDITLNAGIFAVLAFGMIIKLDDSRAAKQDKQAEHWTL